ncbi:MAG TPA: hypothetical protein VGV61_14315 [Thermoanaerobaculia bacterium]|jgi:hypothetical protein|nr:hypothetical protein [Thermoanaerobaculia bacterium]
MRRAATPITAALVSLALALAALGCGEPRPQHVLVLDVKVEQTGGRPGILGATLRFDGKDVARFQQSRPESAVVFSKMVEGATPGDHVVELRIDAQSAPRGEYVAGGVAHFDGKAISLEESGGYLTTGQVFHFDVRLQ